MSLLSLKDIDDVAAFLGFRPTALKYLLYRLPENKKYNSFKIEKKAGGMRQINSPRKPLMLIQSTLKEEFTNIYKNKSCVHGFTQNQNIVSNATQHVNKSIVVNLDLADFFSSINFGRIRGLFLSSPFNLTTEVATVLAQICCCRGFLPQGSPTSPILSNFICRRLDNALLKLASNSRCTYTRYADDITFSTRLKTLPNVIGSVINDKFHLSDEIISIIKNNGFLINPSKVRYALRDNRQEVTGLVVNKRVNVNRNYVRRVRAILNAWEKYGVVNAADEHFRKESLKRGQGEPSIEFFQKRIVGRIAFIGMVRGKDDPIYTNLYKRVKALQPNARLSVIQKELANARKPLILTEGKTDWKHIKAALLKFQDAGEFTDLKLEFRDYLDEYKMSNGELKKICQSLYKIGMQEQKLICIFDRDDPKITPQVTSSTLSYKDWTNNIYSMVLPIPDHRDFDEICIEFYYFNEDLKTYDKSGRRIFLSTEFNPDGTHLTKDYIYKGNLGKLKSRKPEILDSVFNSRGDSVAMSKNDFANYALDRKGRFSNLNIKPYRKLFETLSEIAKLKPTKGN